MFGLELRISSTPQNRAAPFNDPTDIPLPQWDKIACDQPPIAAPNAEDLHPCGNGRSRHGPDRGVHPGGIAPAGQDADSPHGLMPRFSKRYSLRPLIRQHGNPGKVLPPPMYFRDGPPPVEIWLTSVSSTSAFRRAATVSPPPITVIAPRQCASAMARATSRVRSANSSASNHPRGPFQKIGPSPLTYDKVGLVLRIETTTKDVSFFKHYREVEQRGGQKVFKRAPMKKSIYLDSASKLHTP